MDSGVGSFTIDEGYDVNGARNQLIFDGTTLINKTTYDASNLVKEAAERRAVTAGDRWGEGVGTHVGMIPMPELEAINKKYASAEERQVAILCWLRENPALVTFDKFLK